MALEDLSYRDYLQILKRRWGLVAIAGLVGTGFGVFAAHQQAPTPLYQASGVVHYDPERGYEFAGTERSRQESTLSEQATFIRGLSVLGNAAKRLDRLPEEVPPDEYRQHLDTLLPLYSRIEVEPTSPAQQAGNITIAYTAGSPEKAAEVVETVISAYMEENVRELRQNITRRRETLEQQIAENQEKLNETQLQYERFLREYPQAALEPGMPGFGGDRGTQQQLQEKVDEARRQLKLVRSGRPPSDIGLQEIVGSTSTARLQQLSRRYTELTLDRKTLLTERTEAHPAVQKKSEQIEHIRQELERELRLILDSFLEQQTEAREQAQAEREKAKELPEAAMRLAKLRRELRVQEELSRQLRGQLEDALLKEAQVSGQVRIVSPAVGIPYPVNPPRYAQFGSVGLLGGLMVGFLIGVLLEATRFSIRSLRDLEESLDVSLLGANTRLQPERLASWFPPAGRMRQDTKEWSRSLALSLLLAPQSPVSEAFRSLRTQVQSKLPPGPATVSITSPSPGEGVTTTAFNLALSFAQAGQRVLLLEADFRHPAVGELLGVRREPGLADYILGSCRLDDAVRGVADFVTGNLSLDDVLLAPGMDHLHVMPCGQQTANVSELLGSGAFRSILPTLEERYDVILFDSPAVSASADATILARHARTLLVFDPRKSETSDLRDAISRIRTANGELLGFFVNGVEVDEQPASTAVPSS